MNTTIVCSFSGDYLDIEPVVFLFLQAFQEKCTVQQCYIDDIINVEIIVQRNQKNQLLISDLARRCAFKLIETLFIPESKKMIWSFSKI